MHAFGLRPGARVSSDDPMGSIRYRAKLWIGDPSARLCRRVTRKHHVSASVIVSAAAAISEDSGSISAPLRKRGILLKQTILDPFARLSTARDAASSNERNVSRIEKRALG